MFFRLSSENKFKGLIMENKEQCCVDEKCTCTCTCDCCKDESCCQGQCDCTNCTCCEEDSCCK